jgi:hypothetical protein
MKNDRYAQIFVLLVLCFGCGCYVKPKQSPLAGAYYRSPDTQLADVSRVALVALDSKSEYADISDDVSESLYIALQRKQRFGITTVAQSDPLWRGLLLEPDGSYVPEELVRMRQALRCDAVLSGMVTEYKPFPHLTLGLRLSLVDLNDGHLIWGIEHVWDTEDVNSDLRISYYLKTMPGKKSLEAEILRMSPSEFINFVAFEVSETISD